MFDILRRFGFGMSRGFTFVLVLVGATLAAAFWIGPLKPVPAELQLLVLGRDGRFGTDVTLRLPPADSAQARGGRYPLLLAVRNTGARAVEPGALSLSVPARFRLVRGDGTPYDADRSPNNPLLRYRLLLPEVTFAPDSQAAPLAVIDTLWLEPALPDYDCVLGADRVPEFVPAPRYDAAGLARLDVFYAFIGGSPGVRQAGRLGLRVDSAALVRPPVPTPSTARPTVTEPAVDLPDMGALGFVGARRTECGEPIQPIELQTFTWRTASGGLFLVLYQGGAPRKYLFDLDANGVAELEIWDPDGDGEFEASRSTSILIPEALLPATATAVVDTLPTDSAWLANFNDVADGPFRFLPDTLRPEWRAAVAAAADSAAAAARRDSVAAAAAAAAAATPPATQQPPARQAPAPRRDTTPPVRRDTTPPVRRDTLPPVRRDTVRRDTTRSAG